MTKTRIRQVILCAFAVGLVLLVPNARGVQAPIVALLALLFVVAAQQIGRVSRRYPTVARGVHDDGGTDEE